MKEICDYGCGNKAIKQMKNGKYCCSNTTSQCPAIKQKNSQGTMKRHAEGRGYKFTPEDIKKSNEKQIQFSIENAFVENSSVRSESIKKMYLEHFDVEYKCVECGLTDWNGKEIVLELDHINGDNKDNREKNLRLLCPNCHSQTDTFRGKNVNNGFKKVSDEELIEAYNSTVSIRQALIKVGLTPKGGNYNRMKKLIG
jgi:Zn finger protein HypA/HybF involved in hydrogenase expression